MAANLIVVSLTEDLLSDWILGGSRRSRRAAGNMIKNASSKRSVKSNERHDWFTCGPNTLSKCFLHVEFNTMLKIHWNFLIQMKLWDCCKSDKVGTLGNIQREVFWRISLPDDHNAGRSPSGGRICSQRRQHEQAATMHVCQSSWSSLAVLKSNSEVGNLVSWLWSLRYSYGQEKDRISIKSLGCMCMMQVEVIPPSSHLMPTEPTDMLNSPPC